VIRLLAWLAGTLLLLVLAAGGLLVAAVDRQPLVSRGETVSPQSIAQARWLLLSNDPRRLRPGELRRTAMPAALIDDGVNYLATRFLQGRAALALGDGSAEVRLTRRLPFAAATLYLNLRLTLQEADGEPRLAALRIGSLDIPPGLAEFVLATGVRLAGHDREWQLARHAVRELRFDAGRQRIVIGYAWEPSLLDSARSLAIDREELARLRSAHEMLAGLLDHRAPRARVALPDILGPMLDIAGSDQRDNRRAAIFVLAAYLSEKNLVTLIPEAANWPRAKPVNLSLLGRLDSAQHFVISAALAAWAGEPLADAIGLYKEMDDIRHGSGFSFADLAADRAGTRFGEVLVRHPARLDRLLKQPFADTDLVPALADFPEYLGEGDFQRRYGRPGSPAYQQVIDAIDRRLFALPLYRGLERP